jgi:hypothetical protein
MPALPVPISPKFRALPCAVAMLRPGADDGMI